MCLLLSFFVCLKVVIEDQVEDTKFAQEKHIFSMYLDSSLIPLDRVSKLAVSLIEARSIKFYRSAKISHAKKPITYSFEPWIEIRLNRYLKDIISHLLEVFLERETLCLYGYGFVTKFSLFHQTKEFQSRLEGSIGEEAEVIEIITDLLLWGKPSRGSWNQLEVPIVIVGETFIYWRVQRFWSGRSFLL